MHSRYWQALKADAKIYSFFAKTKKERVTNGLQTTKIG
jgi:hypothetical protein